MEVLSEQMLMSKTMKFYYAEQDRTKVENGAGKRDGIVIYLPPVSKVPSETNRIMAFV